MPESIVNLRKENNYLKSKVSTLTEEISRLKDLIQQQSSSAAPSAQEISHSLEFLSKGYYDLIRFKTTASKELQRLSSQLTDVKIMVDAIANAIDEFQEYSFQYNVKKVGVPEVCSNEAVSRTSAVYVRLLVEDDPDEVDSGIQRSLHEFISEVNENNQVESIIVQDEVQSVRRQESNTEVESAV
ncbi:kinetochore protein Nuf2-like [Montipora foliosa]|uniref:kinetochore protein Nuf2-like n=1 Tax=Montipora foliosa TaxID=591990 RepID=UPI0035F110CA